MSESLKRQLGDQFEVRWMPSFDYAGELEIKQNDTKQELKIFLNKDGTMAKYESGISRF